MSAIANSTQAELTAKTPEPEARRILMDRKSPCDGCGMPVEDYHTALATMFLVRGWTLSHNDGRGCGLASFRKSTKAGGISKAAFERRMA